jgi:hypothetical protein
MDEAVRRYQELVDEGKSPLTAALAVRNEHGVALDELLDALTERGLRPRVQVRNWMYRAHEGQED